ncbi:26S proteasome non-ATPase subunit, putative [Eimeria brunetti]|uniref:26S proteasome non-ATPase subunit, putative n=1 Tax=Eimeria brunetti TaxID=51314 RepID=U6LTR9_9EIME|nr:26S proteasome non-ATPase subunit, putative [Eimeria brunetti]
MSGLPPSLRGLLQQFGGLVGSGDPQELPDASEQIYISSLALLKMLKHGRAGGPMEAGVPMEVMGLMLGEFIDDFTVRVVDVFSMPQSGTDVNTQQSFEQLNQRAVGVVVDPIQSVKGKVVMDCFRLINPHFMMLG